MGDSWTEGVGCYDPDLLSAYLTKKIDMQDLYKQSKKRGLFSKGSWPTQLSKMLDCDLINIGEGADSNSGSAKRLIQDYNNIISERTKNYEKVTVVWLISAPERFSFYSDRRIRNFSQEDSNKMRKAYYKDVIKYNDDFLLETSFYLKTVYWYCKANGYNFIYGSAFSPTRELEKIYNPENNIHRYIPEESLNQYIEKYDDDSLWAPCRHPNEKGYTIMAQRMYSIIDEHFKGII